MYEYFSITNGLFFIIKFIFKDIKDSLQNSFTNSLKHYLNTTWKKSYLFDHASLPYWLYHLINVAYLNSKYKAFRLIYSHIKIVMNQDGYKLEF